MTENSLKYTFHNDFQEITIQDLLNTPQMLYCNAIKTAQGAENVIKSATIMDVEDIDNWLREGDILIVSPFYANLSYSPFCSYTAPEKSFRHHHS